MIARTKYFTRPKPVYSRWVCAPGKCDCTVSVLGNPSEVWHLCGLARKQAKMVRA